MRINGILDGYMAGHEIGKMQNAFEDNYFINKIGQPNRARLLAAGNIIDARAINGNSVMEAHQIQSVCNMRDIKPMYGELSGSN